MQVSFIEQRGEEVRRLGKKAIPLGKYLPAWLALGRGCVNFFFFCSHLQVSRVRMSPRELNKATLVEYSGRGAGFPRQAIMYAYGCRQHPFVITVTKAKKSKGYNKRNRFNMESHFAVPCYSITIAGKWRKKCVYNHYKRN